MVEQDSDWERFIDQQLVKLDTQRIDFYMLHGWATGPWDKVRNLRGLHALERAKADGRIGHLGFSFHGSPDAFCAIIDGFDWEFCLIQLNYLDQQYQAGLDGLRYAESHKVGVVVMEALRGGALANVPPAVESLWARSPRRWSPAEWALRWVWDLPGVVSVSGADKRAHGQRSVHRWRRSAANSRRRALGHLAPSEFLGTPSHIGKQSAVPHVIAPAANRRPARGCGRAHDLEWTRLAPDLGGALLP